MRKSIILLSTTLILLAGCGSEKKEDNVVDTNTQNATQDLKTENSAVKIETKQTNGGETIFKTKCATCHGSDAMGRADFPKLAGQSKTDLVKKLTGYKDGTFGNKMKKVMEPNAKSLSSTEIEMIADYLSTIK